MLHTSLGKFVVVASDLDLRPCNCSSDGFSPRVCAKYNDTLCALSSCSMSVLNKIQGKVGLT